MCNKRHKDSEPVAETGTGYKLVERRPDTGKLCAFYKWGDYEEDSEGWIKWDEEHEENEKEDIGFCLYGNKEEAMFRANHKTLALGANEHFYEVEYRGGICQHKERRMPKHPLIILVKEFRFKRKIK